MSGPLSGLRIVVSAGPTYEDIDPVRFIGNRSSGKMGFAVAQAALEMGAFEVVLIAGPVHQLTPTGVQRIDVRSAAQMLDAVMASLPCDVYIGAAAVADFRPKQIATQKIKKVAGTNERVLELEQTTDILQTVATVAQQRPQIVCGFAAETQDVINYARGKLTRKNLDLIAANQVGVQDSGFESDNNTLQLITPTQHIVVGPASKLQCARELLQKLHELIQSKSSP